MKTKDVFCGTKSMGKVAIARGHKVETIDNDSQHNADITVDILDYDCGWLVL